MKIKNVFSSTQINREPPKQLVQACQQIVDCLVETVLRSEEQQQQQQQHQPGSAGQSHRIVACLTTTYLFAKIRPQLLVKHVQTLQPYLNIKCFVQVGYCYKVSYCIVNPAAIVRVHYVKTKLGLV